VFDIKWIRDKPGAFDAGLAKRGLKPGDVMFAKNLIGLDEARRKVMTIAQEARARRAAVSREIAKVKSINDEPKAKELMAEVGTIKVQLEISENQLVELQRELDAALEVIPIYRRTTCRTERTRKTTRKSAGSESHLGSVASTSPSSTSRSAKRLG